VGIGNRAVRIRIVPLADLTQFGAAIYNAVGQVQKSLAAHDHESYRGRAK